ncbi:FadR/GntR family transcriptional regulator [Litoreibacter albidus]|uniref:DNA-binding transcriptional regulator, FadR family n=1 Tax=Litoreibacter albidus TaxID=670155 RepID=A0A1H3CPU5_9RHOB|nr:FadR/GntR family transcriptional regulator [Litoreibacter albidus]SDX55449.1 DNA-binding transcriptional regulator, FadR family [Litoreibacter albidus]
MVKADKNWESGSSLVARQIGSDIITGVYSEGEKLPLEAQLSEKYEVSRNTLREAMRLLAAKNLVEIAPRRGTSVLSREQWNVLDRDLLEWSADHFMHDRRFMEELVRARCMVEPAAAKEAARGATDAQIATLWDSYTNMVAQAEAVDTSASLEADLAFHIAVSEASNNRFIKSIGRSIIHAMRLNFRALFTVPYNFVGNLENHRLVAEKIAARDPLAAEAAMLRLLNQSEGDTIRLFEPDPITSTEGPSSTND